MKKIFSTFVALMLTIVLLGELNVVSPHQAEAGVLTGSGSNGLGIRVPRARDRNVRSTTQVMRASMPQLEYKGSLQKIYARMQRTEKRYQQKLWKWEKKKFRIEQKALKKREKEERKELRAREKARKRALRNAKVRTTGSAGGDGAVATDPREWFTKKIARSDEGGSLSVNEPAKPLVKSDRADEKGKEIKVVQKKKGGFWSHIKRALFGD